MDKVRLGRSELEVTPICFGTWQLGGEWGEYEEEQAKRAIRAALDHGINFFDTAQAYGFGRSERVLGEALRPELDHDRDSLVVATKGGLRQVDSGVERDSSPALLREGVEQSLEALGADYIDLYQVHWPDPDVDFSASAAELGELVAEGKLRHVGVSNFNAAEMAQFSEALPVESLQPPYHLLRREIEGSVLPFCADNDIGVLVYGPLGHGMLTGALDAESRFGAEDWRSGSPMFEGEPYRRNLDRVAELERFASERGHQVGRLAIAWTLANPAVQVAIVGTRNPDHVGDAVAAASIEVSEADLARIDEIMADAVEVPGPSPEM